MRARTRLTVILTVFALATGVAYADGGPGAVYNDYIDDGVLSCNHSRADLVAVLHSGTLNQYGDPLVLARLKLAVRKQLADGCQRQRSSRQGATGATPPATTTTNQAQRKAKASPRNRQQREQPFSAPIAQAPFARSASTDEGTSAFVVERGMLIGILVAVVAVAGWLTKRALGSRG